MLSLSSRRGGRSDCLAVRHRGPLGRHTKPLLLNLVVIDWLDRTVVTPGLVQW